MVGWIDGGRDRDNVKLCTLQVFRIRRECDVTSFEIFGFQFFRRIDLIAHHFDAFGVDVESDDPDVLGEGQGNGQSDVTQAYDAHRGLFVD